MPIRARMTVWYVVLLAVVIAAVGVFVVVRLRADLTDSIDRTLQPAATQIAAGYRAEGAQEFRDTASTVLSGERAAAQVLDSRGRVILSFGDPVAGRPLRRGVRGFRVAVRQTTRRGQPVVVVAAVSTAPVDRSVHRVEVLMLIALPAALALVALGGWWLARRALRPVDTMTGAAAAIGADRLGDRIDDPGTRDEIGHLAATLNSMLERIETGVEEQRRLVADASHELRTPLAAMRAELDVTLRLDDLSPAARAALESTREEVDRLSHTVDDLLTLASADAGRLSTRPESLDLRSVAGEVAGALAPLAARHGVSVTTAGTDAPVRADPASLRHAIRNVVQNAIEFSPRGGRVEVETVSVDGVARLAVADEGPGIAPEDRERVFERFYRSDPSRTRSTGGTGLGLAIAHELVSAAGGRIWVEPRDPRGTVFRLELPLSAP